MTVPARRKLWEHEDYQCPILGTCLSMAELRKLARRLELTVLPHASDYELHGYFVRESRREGRIAQTVNRCLDKKYRKEIRLFAKAADEAALEALWKQSLAAGDVPGPFWAVMSHPVAGMRLLNKVFGEVHMLSHLLGAANRADLKRLSRLETRVDQLSQALSRVQAARRARNLEWAVRVKDLEDRLGAERLERLKLSRQVRETALPRPMGREDEVRALREQLEAASRETRRQAAVIEELYRDNLILREQAEDVSADLERAEQELVRALPCAEGGGCGPGGGCPAEEAGQLPGMEGKTVLYVGGRCNLVRHYRELVERRGGRFHHHDGGMENSASELHGKLASADVVLCPVDCVSHEACLAVKKACRNCMKPFHPLRSSGLSALARSLESLAGNAN
ncbi:hypothetical protein NNJEOMEG_00433 [Fundidesulfovibrio magnetotacticus]|uniref:DUF2325 domain-containing protein n=1 Tax=Fundidesulfovibrio magnetotacticus TaxID=2730080 RepID=A0A6V8LQJ4_9BACT|nr:DUF2325 domain-containing protein [Fundidesulfovibrio magnetotacticus]GFK92608.1 hypothetical protein NNJEOMEG_00433 [Fundidesulfovibrio magnetotacticus]